MPLGWVAGATLAAGAIGAIGSASAASDQADASRNAQNISQQQYQDTVNRNAPFTQSGYGALSQLNYLLGVSPQDAQGNPVSSGGSSGGNGTDPSSGYHIGAGGGISQLIPYSGNHASTGYGSIGQNGMSLGQTVQPRPGSGPVAGAAGSGASAGAPAGGSSGGYGSLLKPFDTSDWQQLSPAYNFQKQQGTQGVLNGAASGQGALSGSAYKDLIDYNQNAANTSFNNAFNQYQTQQGNIYSRLSGIAQLGQSSANNTGQQGTALAGQAAQSATNIGTAQAGGAVGIANSLGGAAQSAAPWLQYGGGGGNAASWDTENPSNFQDFGAGLG
jgi:hypothetical protein